MSKKDLRGWLAKQLKRDLADPVMEKLWSDLGTYGYIDEALNHGEAGKSDLLDQAKALLPHAELMAGPVKQPKPRKPKKSPGRTLQPTGYEEERAKALGEFLAFNASSHPLVQRFREEALDGRPISPEQALALILSPAASRFPTNWFKKQDIPVVGYTAHFYKHGVIDEGVDPNKFTEFEDIFVDPPGKLFRAYLPMSVFYTDLPYLKYPNEEGKDRSGDHYSEFSRDQEYIRIPVYPRSVLDDLRQFSFLLSGEPLSGLPFPAWEEAQAAQFVLTDEAVAPKALTAHFDIDTSDHLVYGTITLTIQSWVPTKTVVEFYQDLQTYVLERKPRAPSRRNLQVFSFVARQLRGSLPDEGGREEASRRLSWSDLMERWNRAHPEQKYTSESQFSRDFRRGRRAVEEPFEYRGTHRPLKLSIP